MIQSAPRRSRDSTQDPNHDDQPEKHDKDVFAALADLVDRPAGAFIFSARGLEDCVDSGSQPAVVIPFFEEWRNLVVENPFGQGIRQSPLKSVPRFNPRSPVLDKNEKDSPVILALLS